MTTKEELRKLLDQKVSQHLEHKPDACTLYAAQRPPDKMPWRKRPNLLDKAYSEALATAEQELARKDV
jgi:hypothetical protein